MMGEAAVQQNTIQADLYYVGDISGKAKFSLTEPEKINMVFDRQNVMIQDVRDNPGGFSVDVQGFEYVKCPTPVVEDPALVDVNLTQKNLTHPLNMAYHDTLVDLILEMSGAREVIPQYTGLLLRTTGGSKKSWAGPANFVHLDYTVSCAQMHCANALYEFGKKIKPWSRFVAYQTWRAISSGPHENTLAICDGRSVAESETVEFESDLGPAHAIGTHFFSRGCRFSNKHQWYYMSDMQPEDLLVFKGFDTDIPDSRNAMHTGFDNPAAGPDARPRVSLEARYFAIYD